MDQYRVTERTGWGSRIGGALTGVVVGILLFIVSFPVLWWNEGRALDRAETLAAGLEQVVPIDPGQLDPATEGRLVHISGTAQPDGGLNDPLFGVAVDALGLRRVVEMYQWVEETQERTVTDIGGGERTETTYSYSKTWSQDLQNSSKFRYIEGHENPGAMPFDSRTVWADRITVGAFALGRDFVDQLDAFEELAVANDAMALAASDIPQAGYKILGGRFQKGNAADPKIGDVRVRFEIVRPQEVSAVGEQKEGRLETLHMKRGEIALLEFGRTSARSMFKTAEEDNLILTWVLRLMGFLMMWFGLSAVLWPAKIIADVLPFLGHVVGGGVSMITGLVAIGLSALTISLAWIAARPLIGGILLVVSVLACLGVGYLVNRRRAAAEKPVAEG